MKRRILIFGILIILIGISFTPLNQGMTIRESYQPIVSRNTLYVGGSGPNNYTRIQYAIDDASNGDTVFVYEGEYNELIQINTTINLIGEDKTTTIINGSLSGNVITINANDVGITDFTIIYGDRHGIYVKSDNSIISNNIFYENDVNSIHMIDSNNHTITENIFHYVGDRCIDADYSHYNIISGNTFTEKYDPKISLGYCDFNILSDNQATYGYNFLNAWECNNLLIANNTMFGYGVGSALYLSDMVNCTIIGNIISGFNEGLWLTRFNYSTITDNEIINSDDEGIYFLGKCNYNVISNNVISGNEYAGIVIQGTSSNNTIIYNTINTNPNDIYIKAECYDQIIYHNNFNDITPNVIDLTLNIWNDSYPSGGNYWSDYTGYDSDGDGIGDTARNVSGGAGNKDYYPLMNPWGEQRPVANYTYKEEYGGFVFNASSSYDRDGEVVSFEWDFGDGTTDSGMVVAHSYNSSGQFDVLLTVTDDEGYTGSFTMTIDAVQNYPPEIPVIDGPSSGKWGKPHHFTFQSTDVEGSNVWYFVDWGDGSDTGWMGPFVSGDEVSEPHTWTDQETYVVRCKAKDMYGVQSDWADHEITIPRNRAVLNSLLSWFLERFLMLERLISLLL